MSSNSSTKMSKDQLKRAVRVIVMYDAPLLNAGNRKNTVETCKQVMHTLTMNFNGFDKKEAERVIYEELLD